MSRHQTSLQNTIESTQLPQDTSTRWTSMLFSSLELLLRGTATVRGSLTRHSGARSSPSERPGSRSNITM